MKDFGNNKELIEHLQKGDKAAFRFVIKEYNHRLCVYANSLISNHIQAEDIVQAVYANLWEKREKLNSGYSLKSFLYKSVYNEFIDQYRKSQSVLRIEKKYMEVLDSIVMEKDHEKTQKLIQAVKEIIQELPPKCKQVFELSKTEGLTNIEISEYLGITAKGVEAQISRGFKLIRRKLKERTNLVLFHIFNFRTKVFSNL